MIQGNKYEFAQDLEAEREIIVAAFLENGNCGNFIQLDGFKTGEVNLGKGNGTKGYSILITVREKNLIITRLNEEEQLEKSNTGDPYVA